MKILNGVWREFTGWNRSFQDFESSACANSVRAVRIWLVLAQILAQAGDHLADFDNKNRSPRQTYTRGVQLRAEFGWSGVTSLWEPFGGERLHAAV